MSARRATQSVVVGQEIAVQRAASSTLEAERCQLDPPVAGAVDVATKPPESTAADRPADAQDTPTRGSPAFVSTRADAHPPADGSVDVSTFPLRVDRDAQRDRGARNRCDPCGSVDVGAGPRRGAAHGVRRGQHPSVLVDRDAE